MQPGKLASAVICCALTLTTQFTRADDAPAVHDRLSTEAESELYVGARVRLNRGDKTLTGRVLSFDDDTLWLEVRKGRGPLELRRAQIRGLEVSVGRRHKVREGATWGGLLLGLPGMAIGYGLGQIACWTCNVNEVPLSFGLSGALLGGAAAGAVGAGLGALIGSGLTTDKWQPVNASRFSAGLVPTRGGVGASVSFRF